jgi:hypothetical protein
MMAGAGEDAVLQRSRTQRTSQMRTQSA